MCLLGLLLDSPSATLIEHQLFEQLFLALPQGPSLNGPLACSCVGSKACTPLVHYAHHLPPQGCPPFKFQALSPRLGLCARAPLIRYNRSRLIPRLDASQMIPIMRHHLLSAWLCTSALRPPLPTLLILAALVKPKVGTPFF